MTDSHRPPIAPIIVSLALLLSSAVNAQISPENLRLPISLDAESTDYDGKSSMLMFKGLRLSQGNVGVVADVGRASNLDFEESVWSFSGNVVIETENGHIECETADLLFSNHQLQKATINGNPATFEIQRPESEQTTYAEAGELKYDFATGIVEFSDNATITEGGNQISSSYLVYNIVEQRINAQSASENGERVKIVYTPQVDSSAAIIEHDATEGETTNGEDLNNEDIQTEELILDEVLDNANSGDDAI